MKKSLNKNRSKEWVVSCRRKDLLKKDSSYLYNNCKICGEHFEDIMFANNLKNRLVPDAKPTLFNISNPLQKLDKKEGQLRKHCKLLVKVNDACFIYKLKDIVDCCKKKMTDC